MIYDHKGNPIKEFDMSYFEKSEDEYASSISAAQYEKGFFAEVDVYTPEENKRIKRLYKLSEDGTSFELILEMDEDRYDSNAVFGVRGEEIKQADLWYRLDEERP